MEQRNIIIHNQAGYSIGLKDNKGRSYIINKDSKIRIGKDIFQDVIYDKANFIFFEEQLAKVEGITKKELAEFSLTEEQIDILLPNEEKEVEIKAEEKVEKTEEPKAEEIEKEVEEVEEVEEEVQKTEEKPAPKKQAKKKKATTKKKSE